MHEVERPYTRGPLERSTLGALERAGKDLERLSLDGFAPIDEVHVRGREATKAPAAESGLDAETLARDIGCGLGGPSRRLAAVYGRRVRGLDLTEADCRVAEALSTRLGLRAPVSSRAGNALALPFDDTSFEVVWTQRAAMTIGDKARLCGGMYRVLTPGGRLAIYDIFAGPGGAGHFPGPWAREPSMGFLVSPDELRGLLRATGCTITSWKATTQAGQAGFEAMAERVRAEGRPLLGYHLLLGDGFAVLAPNQVRNLHEARIVLTQSVAQRPAL
jgi:MPBQ/MSBQ methyltransferase